MVIGIKVGNDCLGTKVDIIVVKINFKNEKENDNRKRFKIFEENVKINVLVIVKVNVVL